MLTRWLAVLAIAAAALGPAQDAAAQKTDARRPAAAPAPAPFQGARHGSHEIIGSDDRVPSNDPRSGRLLVGLDNLNAYYTCTGFLVSNGAVVTAGHCFTQSQISTQNACPPSRSRLVGQLQFNVPLSSDKGVPNNPASNDIYPLDANSIVCRKEVVTSGGLGVSDWAIFAVKQNPAGQLPSANQSFYRVTQWSAQAQKAPIGIRLTGYGTDGPPPDYGEKGDRNQFNNTQQTAVGQFYLLNSFDTFRNVIYLTDSMGGLSGAAVLLSGSGIAVGINDGGVTGNLTDPKEFNYGTTFADQGLASALHGFPGRSSGLQVAGANIFYVDAYALGFADPPTGNLFFPFPNLTTALAKAGALPQGTASIVSVVKGKYVEVINQTSSVTQDIIITPPGDLVLQMPVGDVEIWSSTQCADRGIGERLLCDVRPTPAE